MTDNALAKTRQAVSRYKSRSQSDSLNATKSVWAAVRFLRKQLPDLERKDRGITTRIARELSDVLGKLPMFKHLKVDKEASENLYNKPQAEEHILNLESQLKAMVKELENSKIDEIKGWVENHPVLGTLTKTLTRKMPDSTYVFLFRQSKSSAIELVTSRAPDGRVFTRFRPREFFDVKKLYRLYHHRPPVGAAVVVDNKLQDVIGTVPEANEGENQMQIISGMSRDAASQPAKVFLSSNSVLQSLHDMAKERKVDKGAYILLFVDAEEELDFDADDDDLAASEESDPAADESETAASDESVTTDAEPTSADESASSEEAPAAESESTVAEEPGAAPAEEVPAVSEEAAPVEEAPTAEETVQSGEPAAAVEETAPAPAEEPLAAPVEESAPVENAEPEQSDAQSEVVETSDQPSTPEHEADSDATLELSAAHQSVVDEIASASDDSQPTESDESSSASEEPGEQTGEQTSSDTTGDAPATEEVSAEEVVEQHFGPVEILTRAGSDGGVITRYYANEFSDVRKIFETFASKRTIAGAAVIRGRELIQVFGNVPQSLEGRSQLDVLLGESNHAADKPTRDFLADNEILNSLHELAAGDFPDANAKVILFIEEEGRLSTLTPPVPPQREERGRDKGRGQDRRGGRDGRERDNRRGGRDNRYDRGREEREPQRSPKTSLLTDFRYPREIRNGYRNLPRVVGASVIGDFKAPQPVRKEGSRDDDRNRDGSRDDKRGRGGDRGRDQRAPRSNKSVVLAAFGKTPLKTNILITEETARRLGLDFLS